MIYIKVSFSMFKKPLQSTWAKSTKATPALGEALINSRVILMVSRIAVAVS